MTSKFYFSKLFIWVDKCDFLINLSIKWISNKIPRKIVLISFSIYCISHEHYVRYRDLKKFVQNIEHVFETSENDKIVTSSRVKIFVDFIVDENENDSNHQYRRWSSIFIDIEFVLYFEFSIFIKKI